MNKVLIYCLISFLLGIICGRISTVFYDYYTYDEEVKKYKTDSLKKALNSLKIEANEKVNNIDTFSVDDKYKFFSDR